MTRRDDWPERLAAHLEAARGRPFAWGAHDCCAWAADWIVAATGEDVFAPWRGYTDAREAMRRLESAGGVAGLWTQLLGQPIAPAFAQRGDVVLVEVDGRETAAVCVGEEIAAPGETDLVRVPARMGRCAWRV